MILQLLSSSFEVSYKHALSLWWIWWSYSRVFILERWKLVFTLKLMSEGWRELCSALRLLSLVPSTHIWWFTTICNSCPRGFIPFPGLWRHRHSCAHTTGTPQNHIIKNKVNLKRNYVYRLLVALLIIAKTRRNSCLSRQRSESVWLTEFYPALRWDKVWRVTK